MDESGERLGKLIRNGEKAKIPVLAVIGAKEAENNTVSLRSRKNGDLGEISVNELINYCNQANNNKSEDALVAAVHS